MIVSIITFVAVLSVLILVHEMGHFFAARKSGVWVEEFGIGYPPRIYGKKFGETLYTINALPFGGFVRLHGENVEDGITNKKRAFLYKNKKTRTAIITAGVLMNFIMAIIAFSATYSIQGIPRDSENVRILDVAEDSPAAMAGIEVDDVVRMVDGQTVVATDQFIEVMKEKGGEEVALSVLRTTGDSVDLVVIPRKDPPESEGALGVVITTTETYFPPLWKRPFVGIFYGFKEAIFWGGLVIGGFVEIFRNLFGGHVPKGIAGPVGIYALTSEAASFGFLAMINFLGILSVNLAILNILPFPALDGGRLLFIGIESVIGKKVVPKVEATIHMIGMVILILLILAVTAQDIVRLIAAGSIAGFIDSVLMQ